MHRHESFEWDHAKAAANLRKHHVSFELAAYTLADPEYERYHVEYFDLDHSNGEDRWLTLASVPDRRPIVLAVSWTPRANRTRIISARKATRRERNLYEQFIQQRQRFDED